MPGFEIKMLLYSSFWWCYSNKCFSIAGKWEQHQRRKSRTRRWKWFSRDRIWVWISSNWPCCHRRRNQRAVQCIRFIIQSLTGCRVLQCWSRTIWSAASKWEVSQTWMKTNIFYHWNASFIFVYLGLLCLVWSVQVQFSCDTFAIFVSPFWLSQVLSCSQEAGCHSCFCGTYISCLSLPLIQNRNFVQDN